jgi:hypothetical protein
VDEHTRLQSIRKQKDLEKDKNYKEESKDRLQKICVTKIRTTMIGALDSIEKRFKEYLPLDGRQSNEQLLLEKIYNEIRTEILDKGNQQIRNLETEFEQYIIEWKRYTLQLPVRRG